MIEFQALGSVRLSGHEGNQLQSILARPKLLGLLAYLACAGPRGFQRRDTLVGVFWPDVDQERARRSLRQSLYHLRAALGEDAIIGRGDDEVGLNATEFCCDVWAFEDAIEANDPEAALEVYRGDFLEGFFLSGLREFEGWVDERRGALRERAATAALGLAERRVDDGSRVANWARLAVRLAPLDEVVVRGAISALDRTGDRAGAVRTYQEFADRLALELDVEPSPETQALVEGIRARGADERVGKAESAVEAAPVTAERREVARPQSTARQGSRVGGFFFEIGRRGVTRVAVAYCLVALAVLEAADLIAPRLQLPDWSVTFILVLLILGFPIVLALAWVFDVGPKGITRTPPPAERVPGSLGLGGTAEMVITLAAVVLVVAAGAWLLRRDRGPMLDADRMLVAGLENQTGDPALATLGSIALDWLTRGLQQTGAIRVIDARLLAADPLGFASGGSTGLDRALTAARETAAGTLLSGAYYRQGDSIFFQVQLTEVVTGELRHSLDPVGGSIDAPLEVIEELRQRVMSTLAALTRFDLRTIPVKPPTYDAYQEFMTGLIMAAQGNSDRAMAHGLRAAELDTSFAAALLLASGEMIGNGQYARADSVLTAVNRRREGLSVLEQTALDGQMALLHGDLAGFVAAARRNDDFFGLSLDQVRGLLWLNRPREAVDVLERMDTTDVLSGGRPEYWRLLHDAYHMLGEFERALEAGARARAKYPDSRGMLLVDLSTLAALGRTEELRARLDEAAALPSASQAAVTDAILEGIYELRAHGHRDASRLMLDRLTERLSRGSADEASSRAYRSRMAAVYYLEERWDDARDQVESPFSEGGYGTEELALLGAIAARLGDRATALAVSEQLRDSDDGYRFGANTLARAKIAAALGERDEAVVLIRGAFGEGLRHGMWFHRDVYFESLRDHGGFQMLMRPKG